MRAAARISKAREAIKSSLLLLETPEDALSTQQLYELIALCKIAEHECRNVIAGRELRAQLKRSK
jgi:hypothetical protein